MDYTKPRLNLSDVDIIVLLDGKEVLRMMEAKRTDI